MKDDIVEFCRFIEDMSGAKIPVLTIEIKHRQGSSFTYLKNVRFSAALEDLHIHDGTFVDLSYRGAFDQVIKTFKHVPWAVVRTLAHFVPATFDLESLVIDKISDELGEVAHPETLVRKIYLANGVGSFEKTGFVHPLCGSIPAGARNLQVPVFTLDDRGTTRLSTEPLEFADASEAKRSRYWKHVQFYLTYGYARRDWT